jgi:DNA repair protein RadC
MARCAKPKRLVARLERGGAAVPAITIMMPHDAAAAAYELIGDRAYEVFLALYLNAANCLIAYEEFTEGSLANVTVNPASIVRDALLAGAIGIITVHQHPSQTARPSDDDLRVWKRLDAQADLMGIKVLDHMIVVDAGFFSNAENAFHPWSDIGVVKGAAS